MLTRFEIASEENAFEVLFSDDDEVITESSSDEALTLIAENLDTLIELEGNTYIAIWTLIGFLAFIVVARLLWTIFDRWFFGGV